MKYFLDFNRRVVGCVQCCSELFSGNIANASDEL